MKLQEEFIKNFGESKWGKLGEIANKLEKFLNYKFTKKNFLLRSLLLQGDIADRIYFETYEFLGDSILNLIISEFLNDHLKLKSPNELTKLKAIIVKNSNLAKLAKKTNIIDLQEIYEGKLTEKHLSDCFESVLGAMYIDMDYNKDNIKPIIIKMLEIEQMNFTELLSEDNLIDKKSQLNEWNLKTFNGDVVLKFPFENKGPPHKPKFYVGLELVAKDGKIIHQEEKIGPFVRLKDGEIAISEKFLTKIA